MINACKDKKTQQGVIEFFREINRAEEILKTIDACPLFEYQHKRIFLSSNSKVVANYESSIIFNGKKNSFMIHPSLVEKVMNLFDDNTKHQIYSNLVCELPAIFNLNSNSIDDKINFILSVDNFIKLKTHEHNLEKEEKDR